MSQWMPEAPQGSTTEQGLVIIGRPPIPKFSPPQGIAVGIAPSGVEPLLAVYPTIGDLDYNNFKFFQVNKKEFVTPQTDFIWEITGSVGPGVFLEASGFDIRPFLNNERDIAGAIDNNNTFDPGFLLNVMQLSDDQLHLFCWEFGADIEEWVLSAPHVFPPDLTPSDFQFTDPDTNGRDIKFLDNGTKMATIGITDDILRLYSLPTPNSFSTPPVLLATFDLGFLSMSPQSCDFSVDGLQLYVIGAALDDINQWDLIAPFTLPAPSTNPDRIFPFNPNVTVSNGNFRMFIDGTAFYLMSSSPDDAIKKYINTDGNFQIPTVNKNPDFSFDVNSFDDNPRAMSVSLDESLIWFAGRQFNIVNELFIPGQLLEYEVVSVNVTTGDFTIRVKVPTIQDLTFVQIAVGNAGATDDSIPLGVVFSGNELDVSTEDTAPRGVTISTDGLTLFMAGNQNDKIYQYDLSTANDLSTAVFSGNELDVSTEDTGIQGMTISTDGLTLFMVGTINDKIFQYNLSTANDLSTAVFSGNELDVSTEDTTPRSATISTDGFTLFMTGNQNVKIYQYDLSTANDLSTAVFSGNELDVSTEDTAIQGLSISTDGLTLFMAGDTNDKIFQYNLSTANDLSTAVFSGNELDVSTEDPAPRGATISANGLTLFMAGDSNDKIYQYDLFTPNSFVGIVLSTFETPLLTQGETNFLVDDAGNNIVAVQS